MSSGTCILVVTLDAGSRLVVGQQDLQEPRDSLYMKPAAALETVPGVSRTDPREGIELTRGEKSMSLIIRFLLHRSS